MLLNPSHLEALNGSILGKEIEDFCKRWREGHSKRSRIDFEGKKAWARVSNSQRDLSWGDFGLKG